MAAVLRVNLIIAGGWGWPGSSQTYVGGVTNLSAVKQIAACLVVGLVLAGCGSATGDSIAFDSDRDGDYEIFVMNADGTGVFSTGQKGIPTDWGGPAVGGPAD